MKSNILVFCLAVSMVNCGKLRTQRILEIKKTAGDNSGIEVPAQTQYNFKLPELQIAKRLCNSLLAKRKYCLKCSPFGQHNTKQLHAPTDLSPERECESCKRVFPWARAAGHRGNLCNTCVQRALQSGSCNPHLSGVLFANKGV